MVILKLHNEDLKLSKLVRPDTEEKIFYFL